MNFLSGSCRHPHGRGHGARGDIDADDARGARGDVPLDLRRVDIVCGGVDVAEGRRDLLPLQCILLFHFYRQEWAMHC